MSTNSNRHHISEASKKNLQVLKRKSYDVKFDLDGTEYTAIETIGSGAYGVVCSAVHHKSKVKVAIKRIHNIFDNQETAKRTFREIKILRHFKHDNIISIREILKPNTSEFKDVYFVFDLMETDLHWIIHSKQELTEEHFCYFLYQILRGLKYIHSANVIHRDLKPGNILVKGNCELKIGDFGMARGIASGPEEHKSYMTQYVATRWYRAPELMFSLVEYTASVDIWSVGCIFAEMLGRRQIFPGRDYINQLKLVINILGTPSKEFLAMSQSQMVRDLIAGLGHKNPVSFRALYPKASSKALDLLGKMLVFNPGDRITVKAALKHLYVNKYHDPEDEPICTPAFNFDFEKQLLTREQLKTAIMKDIEEFQPPKLSQTYDLKFVSKDELEKSSSSVWPDSTASPRMEEAIKQLQELARLESEKEALQKKQSTRKDDQVADIVTGHVTDSKTASDVEMHSAKDNGSKDEPDIKVIDSEPPKSTSERSRTMPSSVDTVSALMSETDVDMPSAKKTENGSKDLPQAETKENTFDTESVFQGSQSQVDPLDAKALIKAFLCRKPRSVSDSSENIRQQHKETARGRREKREEQRRLKERKRGLKKRNPIKKSEEKAGPLLTDADLNLLERWKTMQQSTKPFVHPIRNHMTEIIGLRKEAAQSGLVQAQGGDSVANAVSQGVGQNRAGQEENRAVLAECRTNRQLSSDGHPLVTSLSGVPVVTSQVGIFSQAGVNHQVDLSTCQLPVVTSQVGSSSQQVTVATSQVGAIPPQIGGLQGKVGGVSQHEQVGPPLRHPVGLLTQQIMPLPHIISDPQLRGVNHQLSIIETNIDKSGTSNPQISKLNQPAVAIHHVATLPQPVGGAKQMTGVNQPLPVSWAGPSLLGQLNVTLQAMNLRKTVSGGGLVTSGNHDIVLPIPTSLSSTEVSQPPEKQPAVNTPSIPQQWVPTTISSETVDSSGGERLPSYNEAMRAKSVAIMRGSLDRQTSDSGVALTSGTSLEQPLPHLLPDKDVITVVDLTDSPTKPDSPLLVPCSSKDQTKVLLTVKTSRSSDLDPNWLCTLSKQMKKSHMDELTLAHTPKGSGAGYGVGLDIYSILKDSQPMDGVEQESSRAADSAPLSAPLSASLLADWIDVMRPMTDVDLKALEQELEMGSPSVFVDTPM